MYITFSKTFDNKGQLDLFFLWTGTMLDNFKESGNFLFFIASLIQFVRK